MFKLWVRWQNRAVVVQGTACTWRGTLTGLDEIGIEIAEGDGEVVFLPWPAILSIRSGK